MSSETDWSLNFFDWFKMLPKVLKCTFKILNQEVLSSLQKFGKSKNKRFYAYSSLYTIKMSIFGFQSCWSDFIRTWVRL